MIARQEITGADRQWAEQYDPGDVVRYTKGEQDAPQASKQASTHACEYVPCERESTLYERNARAVRRSATTHAACEA